MNLVYNVKDKPKFTQVLVFALQQLLAILAATVAVPSIVGNGMSQASALLGAGLGTLVYLLFTKFKSPVFLGSSFAFIGSMFAAFSGAYAGTAGGYLGLIIGAVFAGLVYVIIALVVKFCGTRWIDKIMPPVVIGPTVAIIGLSLANNAVGQCFGKASPIWSSSDTSFLYHMGASEIFNIIVALVTLFTVILCSVYGKKMAKMIPFVIGICAGYLVAAVFTVIGISSGNEAMKLIDFSKFASMNWEVWKEFTFIKAFNGGFKQMTAAQIANIAVAYVPVAFVVFAEHIADHKNLSSIIESDLLEDPGLHRTLLGDGVGSMVGAFFGGCPNTTYGESVGCVAISGNASVVTIFCTAIMAIVVAFFAPFVTFLASIPACVMGGVCITLYGFIAVSGLKMIQNVDLGDNRNLFVVSIILICGVGGMVMTFGGANVKLTEIASALIIGIIANVLLAKGKQSKDEAAEEAPSTENDNQAE